MKTVLLIEDNHDIRENTSEILELEGYNVVIASNGKIGLSLAKEILPDIILSDIMMPEADGYEVLNALKNDPETLKIPFVFFTASTEKKDIENGLNMGAKGYIQKPFHDEVLLDEIWRCLNL